MTNDGRENELLSAYLDGELNASERAEVERLLAASPAARQTLDELRALSDTLHALPPQRLNEDLREAVLRQAEREMLTGPARNEDCPAPLPAERLPLWRRLTRPRALVWSGIVVAVAIMLALNDPSRQPKLPHRELALTPAPIDALADSGRRPHEPPSMRALPSEVPFLKTGAAPHGVPAGASDGSASGRAIVISAPAPENKRAAPAAPASSTATPTAPAPGAVAQAAKPSAAAPAVGAKSLPARAAPSTSLADDKNPAVPQGKPLAAAAGVAKQAADANGPPAPRKDRLAGLPMLQVECVVSAETAERRDLERLLARQKMVRTSRSLAVQRSVAEVELQENPARQNGQRAAANRTEQESAAQSNRVFSRGLTADRDSQRNVGGETIRLFYCDATPGQVESTLTTLAARPGALLAVAIHPTAGIGGPLPDDQGLDERNSLAKEPAGQAESNANRADANAAQQYVFGGTLMNNTLSQDANRSKFEARPGTSAKAALANLARLTDRDQTYRVVFVVHVLKADAASALNRDVSQQPASGKVEPAPAQPSAASHPSSAKP